MATQLSDEQLKLAPLFSLGANFSMRSYFRDYVTPDGLISVKIGQRLNLKCPEQNRYYYKFYLEDSFSGGDPRSITNLIQIHELPSFIFEMRYLGYLQNIDIDVYNDFMEKNYET